MSRSFKKTPCFHYLGIRGWYKAHFNRKLRRTGLDAIPDGNAYRRMNETWEIDEARNVGMSFQRYRDKCLAYPWGEDPEEDELKNNYAKYYLRK